MSKYLTREVMADHANVAALPSVPTASLPAQVDRSFEMPNGLYVTAAACYLAFLVILVAAFASPGLAIPMGVLVVLLTGFFGVPAAWTRMAPGSTTRPMAWSQFSSRGISTLTGHLSASEATVQTLILPVLVVLWALAVVTISALI